MLSACQAAAIQIANFIQMKGTDASSVLLSKAFARSFAVAAIIATRCKVCAFSFVRCYCLRVGALVCAFALFEAVFVPFALLFLLLQYFARLARFRAFMWLVLQPRLACK